MDKTDRILQQFSSKVNVTATPIAIPPERSDAFIIPNHSGVHDAVEVTKVYLDKESDTYLWYNRATGNVELYKNGAIVMDW